MSSASRSAPAAIVLAVCAAGIAASVLRAADDARLRRRAATELRGAALPAGQADEAAAAAAAGGSKAGDPRAAGLAAELVGRRPGAVLPRLVLARTQPPREQVAVLRSAVSAAPALDLPATELARFLLGEWPRLSSREREDARADVRRAFRSPDGAGELFPAATSAFGGDAASLLPAVPGPLESAGRALAAAGDLGGAEALFERAEREERRSVQEDLREVRAGLAGSPAELLAACARWADRHPSAARGDAASRRAAAAVLEAWPRDVAAPAATTAWPAATTARPAAPEWEDSGRGALARDFLADRGAGVRASALARAAEELAGTPPPVRARSLLAAGDAPAAARIAATAPDEDPEAWTPYLVDLARREAKAGGPRAAARATAALARVAPEAADDCEVLAARVELARAAADRGALAVAQTRLDALREELVSAPQWISRGEAFLCSDPGWAHGRRLRARLSPAAPALVAWTLGTRSGRLLVPVGGADLVVTLDGTAGSVPFSVRSLGGAATLIREPLRFEVAAAR